MTKHYISDEKITSVASVVIPLLWALVSGVMVGGSVSVLAWVFEWDARAGIVSGVLVSCLSWLSFRSRFERALLDTGTNGTLAGDFVRVELAEDNGRVLKYANLPANLHQLKILSEGLLNGGTFSEASWSGGGNIFTRAEFRQLRDAMLKRGLLVWRNPHSPAVGVELTRGGLAMCRHFASTSEEPPALERGIFQERG